MNNVVSLESVNKTLVLSSCVHVPLGCKQDVQGSQDLWEVGSLL